MDREQAREAPPAGDCVRCRRNAAIYCTACGTPTDDVDARVEQAYRDGYRDGKRATAKDE